MTDVGPFEHAIRAEKVPRDRGIARLAERQHGVVAYRQLVSLGLGRSAIQRRVTSGRIHPLYRGVYAVGHRHLSRHGHWMAGVLACGPAALLSHRTAAALLGLRATAATRIDVTAVGRTRHNRPGIALHRPRHLHREDHAAQHGIPVTSVARTLLDVGQVVPLREVKRALDEAERLQLFDLTAVNRLIARSRGHRGLGRLKEALREYQGPPPVTRSELERRFLEVCRDAGLPRPQVNVFVAGVEVDMVWRARALVVELDGHAYHRTRRAFEDDRKRDSILQIAGYRVVRITHRRLANEPAALMSTLRTLLSRPAPGYPS